MGLTDMGMSANTGSGTVLVVGDVLHEVDHESGLFVDFLCSSERLLTALVVVVRSH